MISYSLYVNDAEDIPFFFQGLEPNLVQLSTLYPGWVARVYTNIGSRDACSLICAYDNLFWCEIKDIPGLGNNFYVHTYTMYILFEIMTLVKLEFLLWFLHRFNFWHNTQSLLDEWKQDVY